MYALVDSMPIDGFDYVVASENTTDNTFSLLALDNPKELAFMGINDVRDHYVGVPYEVYDDEGTKYKVMRLV